LWLGTNAENIADAKMKHRYKHGMAHRSAKLTVPQVYEIRALQGMLTSAATGERYGVGYGAILNIWARKTWWHLPGLPMSL
jgi:hypothetical protein